MGNIGQPADSGPHSTNLEITRYYYFGDQRVAMRKGSELYYLHTDHLGSVSLTTNASGAVVAENRYLPFGAEHWSGGATQTDFSYTGQRLDGSINLYWYKSRWYDPYLNRWTSPDIVVPDPNNPLDWDRYSYVRENPVNFNDPSGHYYCPAHLKGAACVDDDATSKDSYLNIYLYIKAVNRDFGMILDDAGWNLNEAQAIYSTLYQMKSGIDIVTGGYANAWIQKNLGGTVITLGDLLGSSFVLGSTIHLAKDFNTGGWMSLNGKYDTMVIHEFGHILDNRSKGSFWDAPIFGAGAGDQLMDFINAKPKGLFGIRALGGVDYGENKFRGYDVRYPREGPPSYGNNSTADYFANTFVAAVAGYQDVPQPSSMWMAAYIDLTK